MVTMLLLALSFTEQQVDSHVRTFNGQIQTLIDAATSRSPTFRRLIARLNESDVLVYLDAGITRDGIGGYLLHRVTVQGAYRYLRLIVSPQGSDERLIGVIAHELQHAVEIAEVSEVGRSETVQDFFARIGFNSGCGNCYETIDAVDVERTVREELNASRRTKSRN
jgi:hypothetical protein